MDNLSHRTEYDDGTMWNTCTAHGQRRSNAITPNNSSTTNGIPYSSQCQPSLFGRFRIENKSQIACSAMHIFRAPPYVLVLVHKELQLNFITRFCTIYKKKKRQLSARAGQIVLMTVHIHMDKMKTLKLSKLYANTNTPTLKYKVQQFYNILYTFPVDIVCAGPGLLPSIRLQIVWNEIGKQRHMRMGGSQLHLFFISIWSLDHAHIAIHVRRGSHSSLH